MINPEQDLFPYCIVWTVLPCISWMFPMIGHVGICDSKGVIYDFLGNYINKRNMAFGRPIKYVRLHPESAEEYDQALQQTNWEYEKMGHNLCCNNCHHHVANVLARVGYKKQSDWSQFDIWWLLMADSSYVSNWGIVQVYLPLLVLLICAGGLVIWIS